MWEPTVGSVMTKEIVTARPDVPFRELVALMSQHSVSGLPVMGPDGRPVGVVSEADTLAKQEYRGGTARRPWWPSRQRRVRWRKAEGQTAAELMTAPVVVIREDDTVSAAARLLAKKNVRRLCVVDADGVLIGVVAVHDKLRYELDDTVSAGSAVRTVRDG
jgi:CBS domain-containing protein